MKNYKISICKNAAPYFKDHIDETYEEVSYIDKENVFEVHIPNYLPFIQIEDELFKWKKASPIPEVKNCGFWGESN